MYNPIKKYARTCNLLLIACSLLLTACGGASSDSDPETPTKPGFPSSIAELSQASSSEPLASSTPSSSAATSESTSLSSSSASSHSLSSSSTYTRVSRASSSRASSQPAQNTSSSAVFVDTDTTAPINTYLLVYEVTESSVTLMWDDASDDKGVRSYEIRRNGLLVATPEFHINRITDVNLAAATEYYYTIKTFDLAGNTSEESPMLAIKTAQKQSSSSRSSSKPSSSSTSSSAASKSSLLSSSSSSSASSGAAKPTQLRWSHPNSRVSGKYMELSEIGGYSIRYRKRDADRYDYLTLSGNQTTTLTSSSIPYDGLIEIATIDTDGLHSQYVTIAPSN